MEPTRVKSREPNIPAAEKKPAAMSPPQVSFFFVDFVLWHFEGGNFFDLIDKTDIDVLKMSDPSIKHAHFSYFINQCQICHQFVDHLALLLFFGSN